MRIWNTHADVIGRMTGCPWPSIFMMSYAHLIHDMANDRLISGSSTATLPPHAPSYKIPYYPHKGPSPVVMSAFLERNTHHLDTHVFERKFPETEMDLYSGEYVDPMYQAKSRIINHSIQDIGMGKYQWCLFAAAGFGWFADSVWPSFSGLILAPAMYEFHFNGSLLALALNIGLLVGGLVWGLYGRWPFNITLLIAGIFGVAAGASPNFVSLAVLMSFVGLGVGGNVPVDAAVFLDFVPSSHQYLLTILSIWWCMGQLLGNLITWPLISNFTCTSATDCDRSSNMGWRYLLFTLGGLMLLLWGLRFFCIFVVGKPPVPLWNWQGRRSCGCYLQAC